MGRIPILGVQFENAELRLANGIQAKFQESLASVARWVATLVRTLRWHAGSVRGHRQLRAPDFHPFAEEL